MAISQTYRDDVREKLEAACTAAIGIKPMFGGAGVYLDDVFFALMKDDRLYFRVDDSNRADYEAAGMAPFSPYPNKERATGYYELPKAILENREELGRWAQKAVEVSRATNQKRKPKAKKG